MAAYDFSTTRLFVESGISIGAAIMLNRAQANYLLSVLRLKAGDEILVFNGRDGEWRAAIEPSGRKAASLRPVAAVRHQPALSDLVYLFAPLKHARLDYVVQKAVEMGVGQLRPVLTRRTVATRVNGERMRANAIEAAEQCGILSVPAILPEADLADALRALEPDRLLVFCDENAAVANPLRALAAAVQPETRWALLVGPEGGFDEAERTAILARQPVLPISLGPRILRADTAAVAALTVLQATAGDWR